MFFSASTGRRPIGFVARPAPGPDDLNVVHNSVCVFARSGNIERAPDLPERRVDMDSAINRD